MGVYVAKKKVMTQELAESFVEAARKLHHSDGQIEIDHANGSEAIKSVSGAETIEGIKEAGGAYVKAYVWVPIDSLSKKALKSSGLGEDN